MLMCASCVRSSTKLDLWQEWRQLGDGIHRPATGEGRKVMRQGDCMERQARYNMKQQH